jgi:hypothetical protein
MQFDSAEPVDRYNKNDGFATLDQIPVWGRPVSAMSGSKKFNVRIDSHVVQCRCLSASNDLLGLICHQPHANVVKK